MMESCREGGKDVTGDRSNRIQVVASQQRSQPHCSEKSNSFGEFTKSLAHSRKKNLHDVVHMQVEREGEKGGGISLLRK